MSRCDIQFGTPVDKLGSYGTFKAKNCDFFKTRADSIIIVYLNSELMIIK